MEGKLSLTSAQIEESLEAITKFMEKFNRVMNKSQQMEQSNTYNALETQNDEIQVHHILKKSEDNIQIQTNKKFKNKLSTVVQQSVMISDKGSLSPIQKRSYEQNYLQTPEEKVIIVQNLNHQENKDDINSRSNLQKFIQNQKYHRMVQKNNDSKKKSESMKKIIQLKDSIKQQAIRDENPKLIISQFDKQEQLIKKIKTPCRKIVKIKTKTKCNKENNFSEFPSQFDKKSKLKLRTQQSKEIQTEIKRKGLKDSNYNHINSKIGLKECISRRKVNLFENHSNRKKGLSLTKSLNVKTEISKEKRGNSSKEQKENNLITSLSKKFNFKAPTLSYQNSCYYYSCQVKNLKSKSLQKKQSNNRITQPLSHININR